MSHQFVHCLASFSLLCHLTIPPLRRLLFHNIYYHGAGLLLRFEEGFDEGMLLGFFDGFDEGLELRLVVAEVNVIVVFLYYLYHLYISI